MAVYLVKDSEGNETLVETRTKAGAINHVTKHEYTAVSLNTAQLLEHIRAGAEVETVGDDTEEVDESNYHTPEVATNKKAA